MLQQYLPRLKSLVPYVIALTVLITGLTVVNLVRSAGQSAERAKVFELQVQAADSMSAALRDSIRVAQDSIKAWKRHDDSVAAKTRWEKTRAGRRLVQLRVAAQTLPDTCQPTIHALVATADSLKQSADVFESLWQSEKRVSATLTGLLTQANAVIAAKDRAIEKAPLRESFWSKLQPEVRVGPFAGVCLDGKPCAGVGVQVSAKIGRIL
ncbi:MAG: hypothetical protein K0S14_1225 [Thermomicrobiales bacterium]|jgi:hypothetical protein|nr:hypothetical protein [Thermomicrobiales bacterium]